MKPHLSNLRLAIWLRGWHASMMDLRLLGLRRYLLAHAVTAFSVAQKREGIKVVVEP